MFSLKGEIARFKAVVSFWKWFVFVCLFIFLFFKAVKYKCDPSMIQRISNKVGVIQQDGIKGRLYVKLGLWGQKAHY